MSRSAPGRGFAGAGAEALLETQQEEAPEEELEPHVVDQIP